MDIHSTIYVDGDANFTTVASLGKMVVYSGVSISGSITMTIVLGLSSNQ